MSDLVDVNILGNISVCNLENNDNEKDTMIWAMWICVALLDITACVIYKSQSFHNLLVNGGTVICRTRTNEAQIMMNISNTEWILV